MSNGNRIDRTLSQRAVLVSAGVILTCSAPAMAWLGGFESADGYQPFLNRVERYNAGQYGVNSGYAAMSPVTFPVENSGLWTRVVGGDTLSSPTSYVTGHQNFDRSWVNDGVGVSSNQGLVITTNHQGWDMPALEFDYAIDNNDLGGVNPTDPNLTDVSVSFWWCSQLPGPELGGEVAEGYFGNSIEMIDSNGNVGLSLGITQRATGDKVTYWDGTSLNESSIIAAANRYDRWDISIDLVNDTFSADYFSFATSTTTNLVSNAPLMMSLDDLSQFTFRSSPGVNNAKRFSVDDFSFRAVPAPGTTAVVLATGLVAARRRR